MKTVNTVIRATEKRFKSQTAVPDSGLCGRSRDQKSYVKYEFEGFKC